MAAQEGMLAKFDFVTDEDLRASLEADDSEMAVCLGAKAHKATVVLAGSLIEALLTDHLDSIGYADPKGKPLLEMDMGQLIAAARSKQVLSAKAADMSSVVKGYRNLIHPGRAVRLAETVDGDSAAVAGHLVEIVRSEVAKLKQDSYGYTSQQIVSKVENDSSSVAILPDLLKATNDREIERLLIQDLPARYVALAADEGSMSAWMSDPQPILARLRRCYRSAFDYVTPEIKSRVVKDYARALREEVSEFELVTRERDLFQASDMEFMSSADADMARRHLVAQVGRTLEPERIESLKGIASRATLEELREIVDAAVRLAYSGERRNEVGEFLQELHNEALEKSRPAIRNRMEGWRKAYEEKNPTMETWVRAQRDDMELGDLPF